VVTPTTQYVLWESLSCDSRLLTARSPLQPSSQPSTYLCPNCVLATAPLDTPFTLTTPVGDVETVNGIFIPADHTTPAIIPVQIHMHFEPGKSYRIPQLGELGAPNTIFHIPITKGPAGQLLSCPYHVYFQTRHQGRPNICVPALTRGTPKYEWFGDIVVLKFDGQRKERYKDVSLRDDLTNVAWFFMDQVIPSQERQT
jgi:hypothetical protein